MSRLLTSVIWDPEDADKMIFCNACMSEMGILVSCSPEGFYEPTLADVVQGIIFCFETWAIANGINNLKARAVDYSKIIIHMDSMNTVNIFNSLWCLPKFNTLLCICINTCLSNFDKAWKLVLELTISNFEPPQFLWHWGQQKNDQISCVFTAAPVEVMDVRTPDWWVDNCSKTGNQC